MADAFISYSRRDSAYVDRLARGFERGGKVVWVDVEGIRDADAFPVALRRAIESSDAFLFVISPDSAHSEFCEQEVAHAADLNKRIVPLALREVPDAEIPDEIRFRNWIRVAEESDEGLKRVLAALDADLEWEHQHTRLTVKALAWDAAGRDRSFLVRGTELAAAERWLAASADRDPGPTALEQSYMIAARTAASRRQRTLVGASFSVAVVAIALLVFALISRSEAVSAQTHDRAQALAGFSEAQAAVNPELAVLLGIRAVRAEPTSQAMFALRAALDASPIRLRLPGAPPQSCESPGPLGYYGYAPALVFSPDGRQIAEGLCSGAVRLIAAASGRVERTIRLAGPAMQLAYVAGDALAVLAGGRLLLVDPLTGQTVVRGPRFVGDSPLAVDRRAGVIAVGGIRSVALWNVRTGRLRQLPIPHNALSAAIGVALNSDGTRIAVALFTNVAPALPPFIVLDARSGRILARAASTPGTGGATKGFQLAFTPDARELVVAQKYQDVGQVAVRDVHSPTLRVERVLLSEQGAVADLLALSPDGQRAAYGFAASTTGTVATNGEPVASYGGAGAVPNSIAFSPDGLLAVEGLESGDALVWRAHDLTLASAATSGPATQLDVAPVGDGYTATSLGDNALVTRLWHDVGTPAGPSLVLSHSLSQPLEGNGFFAVTPFDPSFAKKAPIRIWDIARRRVVAVTPPVTEPEFAMVLRGLTLAEWAAGKFGLLDARNGHEQTLVPASSGNCGPLSSNAAVATDPSSRFVGYSTSCGAIRVWDRRADRWAGPRINIAPHGIDAIALTPDGREIAAGLDDDVVNVYSVATARLVRALPDAQGAVYGLAYSRDGRYLGTASQDHTIRSYDAHRLGELRVITTPTELLGVWFTSDSRDVLAWNVKDRVVREYDASPTARTRGRSSRSPAPG